MILIFHLDFQVFDSGLFVDMVNWEIAAMLEFIFNHCPWGLLIVSPYMSSTLFGFRSIYCNAILDGFDQCFEVEVFLPQFLGDKFCSFYACIKYKFWWMQVISFVDNVLVFVGILYGSVVVVLFDGDIGGLVGSF